MKGDYWISRWEKNEIGFHMGMPHPALMKCWSTLKVKPSGTVLVPLCGKTLDLLWLAEQGYNVIGVEISQLAVEAFFDENKLTYEIFSQGALTGYRHQNITIFCGDFFNVSRAALPSIDAVYDRAALIALPEDLRIRYAKHLTELMSLHSQMLVILVQTPDNVEGPPFPIFLDELHRLYPKENFQITECASIPVPEIMEHLVSKGYQTMTEATYHVERYR